MIILTLAGGCCKLSEQSSVRGRGGEARKSVCALRVQLVLILGYTSELDFRTEHRFYDIITP
jgi:hypothetical protein